MRDYFKVRDYLQDTQLINRRIIILFLAASLLLVLLLTRMFYLQFVQHDKFYTLSQENRINIEIVPPTRGNIYDVKGRILAQNIPVYSLVIVPDLVDDYDLLFDDLQSVIDFQQKDIDDFFKQKKRQSRHSEIVFLDQLDEYQVARLAVNQHRFKGTSIKGYLKRYYPYGDLTAHVLGYVGRISEKDLANQPSPIYKDLDYIGKSGLEYSYEAQLVGELGHDYVEKNVHGQTLRVLEHQASTPGKDIHLSLDIDLQRVAIEALGEEKGAVVAIRPKTGEVLALASAPTYDANAFVRGIDQKSYELLRDNPDRPLINRSVNGSYAPGSTIKGIIGLAALNRGIDPNAKTYCPGYFSLPGSSHRYRCWRHSGHGNVDMHDAIMTSCDVYFYQLALEMGVDYLHEYLSQFGIGQASGIDLPRESTGLMPNKEWKKTTRNESWYQGETVITGIGQGYMLVTPLQLAAATATLANKGHYITPHLVQGMTNPQDLIYTPVEIVDTPVVNVEKNADYELIIQSMVDVVHSDRGTAKHLSKDSPYIMAGKTGTAQVVGIAQNKRYDASKLDKKHHDHALFIGFAPADSPDIAVAVIVENGGSGGKVAGPIAKKVMDFYLLGPPPEIPDLIEDVAKVDE